MGENLEASKLISHCEVQPVFWVFFPNNLTLFLLPASWDTDMTKVHLPLMQGALVQIPRTGGDCTGNIPSLQCSGDHLIKIPELLQAQANRVRWSWKTEAEAVEVIFTCSIYKGNAISEAVRL